MPSFDQYLNEFFSTPRTLEAQLLAPNAKSIQDICNVLIPALESNKEGKRWSKWSPSIQKIISQFAGNTPAGVPLWAVAIKPDFFKKVRPHFRKSMWTTSTRGDGHGSGRADLYSLQLVNLTANSSNAAALRAVWQSIIDARVFVKHLSPPFRFTGRRGSLGSHVTEVNTGVTAVRKSDGYWMHIERACATPCIEYRLAREPNYD